MVDRMEDKKQCYLIVRRNLKSVNLDDDPVKLIEQLLVLNMEGMLSNPILSRWYNHDVYNKIGKLFLGEDGLRAIDFLYRDFLRLIQKWQVEGKK